MFCWFEGLFCFGYVIWIRCVPLVNMLCFVCCSVFWLRAFLSSSLYGMVWVSSIGWGSVIKGILLRLFFR